MITNSATSPLSNHSSEEDRQRAESSTANCQIHSNNEIGRNPNLKGSYSQSNNEHDSNPNLISYGPILQIVPGETKLLNLWPNLLLLNQIIPRQTMILARFYQNKLGLKKVIKSRLKTKLTKH